MMYTVLQILAFPISKNDVLSRGDEASLNKNATHYCLTRCWVKQLVKFQKI